MENKFYVYEWYIVSTNEVFYVGKGTGKRVTSAKSRCNLFEKIKSTYDTNYRIVFNDLSEEQALELEARQMLIRRLENNYLVNIEETFFDYYFPDLDDAYIEYCEKESDKYDIEDAFNDKVNNRDFVPIVGIDDISKHYFGIPEDAVFDTIDDDIPEVYLHQRATALRNNRIQEEVEFIKSAKTKTRVRTKKCAKYIVEFEIPSYDEVTFYRTEGYKVIHALDLIKHINNGSLLNYKSK